MPSGILIIDKPAGWTSMDVCAKVRGIFREKRVGHGGTLDPMATGVLPVFVGQATRGVEFAENGQKEYVAGLRLGLVTDTQDTTGTILEIRPVTADRAAVEAVLPRFLGEQDQIPPMYSAIKVGGQKLYELARKGQEVARKPGTSPSMSWSCWPRRARRTTCSAAAAPRARTSAPSATTSARRWAAAGLCAPSGAPWPPDSPWTRR